MKKTLNGLGIIGSLFLTIILTVLIFVYVVLLNIKFIIGPNGLPNVLKNIDIVETFKSIDNGTAWEDFKQLADELNLSDEQFEKIINNKKIKAKIGSYFSDVIASAMNEEKVVLEKDKMDDFLNLAIDEYNKVGNKKIDDSKRKEIMNYFSQEMIDDMNEEFSSLNFKNEIDSEYFKIVDFAYNIFFGNYTLIMLVIILAIIGLIALFRFSYYKWIPYVNFSMIFSGLLMIIIGALVSIIPLDDVEILIIFKNALVKNIFITAITLFVITVILSIIKKCIMKKISNKAKEVTSEQVVIQNEAIIEEEVETEEDEENI